MTHSALLRRLPDRLDCSGSELLDRFLDYLAERRLDLYPAQEEAILELFDDRNVILNTPTGSGKSLVATALHFKSMAQGRRSVYTCPIKALVNEKFLALCRDFGPENVGIATGDATVNRSAPILCCTAEILANVALSEGAAAPYRDIIMDEFHYYSDASRGMAWQLPLLTLSRSRFLLMSATLGATTLFERELTRLTGAPTTVVASATRPVPLQFRYEAKIALEATVAELVASRQSPVYVVHFTQNDAAQTTQDLMSQNYCTAEEKAAIAEALIGVKFNSPYGKDMKRFLRHGIGLHHAGLLPKYRMLVERLAQKGLLKVICGTDTLGVGVNVPIRTVVLTRLSKYSGSKVALLTARDFHQITGRAGRKGFDDIGYVVAMAPEHVIENARLEAKAGGDPAKLRKIVKRKPPDKFVAWNEETFAKLQTATPEPLGSRFEVTHAMLLQVLSRKGDGCRAMQQIIRDSHETPSRKKAHGKRAWQLFRSLLERRIIEILPRSQRGDGGKLRLNIDLQEDFSLNHALSLWLIDTLALLEMDSPTYPLDLLTLIESILENPDIILRRQLDALKTEKMAEMKQQGIEYEERIAKLDELEYPKPQREFVYNTFAAFVVQHPWVGQENIRPKSIVREMVENYIDIAGYIKLYDLERVEGVLLRHVSSVHKVLAQTVPPSYKNEDVQEIEDWLAGLLRGTDSSLLDEWERLKNPDAPLLPESADPAQDPEPIDITRNKREFTALIRTEIFHFLRPLAAGMMETAAQLVPPWTGEELLLATEDYFREHSRILLDPEARNHRHTYITPDEARGIWTVAQVLVDPDGLNDWQAVFTVDKAHARDAGKPALQLVSIGPIC
ncbi:MAG: DEAD/DEAH box helicase [Pseudohongiellaceae bacterium]